MEEEGQKEDSIDGFEIDAFDLLKGKMSKIAVERLHKQMCA